MELRGLRLAVPSQQSGGLDMSTLIACAWCMKPTSPKVANHEVRFRDGSFVYMHGTCAADIVQGALEARKRLRAAREKEALANGAQKPAEGPSSSPQADRHGNTVDPPG